ncbi:hypothetical protein [Stenotrophomonas maltophilia]|uniref:hypothetical protein n=1 Tax=Stenotrophomonas maltophilia TaxID=40324 RepID=UPI00118002D6|nr:hypothetical protein [Stenotrophomonas maltophilia]
MKKSKLKVSQQPLLLSIPRIRKRLTASEYQAFRQSFAHFPSAVDAVVRGIPVTITDPTILIDDKEEYEEKLALLRRVEKPLAAVIARGSGNKGLTVTVMIDTCDLELSATDLDLNHFGGERKVLVDGMSPPDLGSLANQFRGPCFLHLDPSFRLSESDL